jgi:hypothetical protein
MGHRGMSGHGRGSIVDEVEPRIRAARQCDSV